MDKTSGASSASSSHLQEAPEVDFKHKSNLLDEGLDESFPASDPVAISVTRIVGITGKGMTVVK